eukprot:15446304-Alexandrium_andersonii.AAC.1
MRGSPVASAKNTCIASLCPQSVWLRLRLLARLRRGPPPTSSSSVHRRCLLGGQVAAAPLERPRWKLQDAGLTWRKTQEAVSRSSLLCCVLAVPLLPLAGPKGCTDGALEDCR